MQKLKQRAGDLQDRTHIAGFSLKGPTLVIGESERRVLGRVFTEMQSHWVLHNDGALEMGAAVVESLSEIRGITTKARLDLADENSDGHEPLKKIEAACARFIHGHPAIDRRDFNKPIDPSELEDLYEVRIEIAEAVRDVLDADGLKSAQDLFNFIEIEREPSTPWLPPGS